MLHTVQKERHPGLSEHRQCIMLFCVLAAPVHLRGEGVSSCLWLPLSLLQWNSCADIIWKCCSGCQSRPNAQYNPVCKAPHGSCGVGSRAADQKEPWGPWARGSQSDSQLVYLHFGRTKNYLSLRKTLEFFQESYLGPVSLQLGDTVSSLLLIDKCPVAKVILSTHPVTSDSCWRSSFLLREWERSCTC